MQEAESYVTKRDSSVEDWMEYNNDLFTLMREESDNLPSEVNRNRDNAPYAPLVDADLHAEKAGVTVEELFETISESVDSLGRFTLCLVHSDMDDAWGITVALKDNVQDQ